MATTTATRRLAAILAADVVGYSRLMGADEEGTHERVKAHLVELLDPKIREHHGRIVKTTGDGVLAEFASVVDAVRCAGEIQRAMADRDLDLAEERRLRFRIGVNLGDVIADGGDIYGDGVNIAARLEGLAAPGGICVSGTVRDHIGDRLPYVFEDRGEQSVKNIARPVRVYALRQDGLAGLRASSMAPGVLRRRLIVKIFAAAVLAVVAIAGTAWWFWPVTKSSRTPAVAATTSTAQPMVAARLSIVVLPFANLSDDPERQYFADGITEDLTTDLSRIEGMLVISRNTAFTYQGKRVDTKQIGRELGVRYVLEGSVRRSSNKVRVSAQLIDATTDTHLWAEQFDRDAGDLLALQSEITSRIANALNVELIAAEAARRAEHPDALDYIFRGRSALNGTPTSANFTKVIGFFERALELDPGNVETQSWLAMALVSRMLNDMTDSRAADLERAEGLIGQVLAASPRSPLAHFAKAQLLRAKFRCEEAIPEYETALTSRRNWAAAIANIGRCKIYVGPIEEAIPQLEQAIRLSPLDPNIGFWFLRIGEAHLVQSHIGEAIVWLEKGRSAVPELAYVHGLLASAYALNGETERSAAELAEARRLSPSGLYSSIAALKAPIRNAGVPELRALYEATYFAGLRKAGVPEE